MSLRRLEGATCQDDEERRHLRVLGAAETGTKNSFGFVRQIADAFIVADPSKEIED